MGCQSSKMATKGDATAAVSANKTLLGSPETEAPVKDLTNNVAQGTAAVEGAVVAGQAISMSRHEASNETDTAYRTDLQDNQVHGPMLKKQCTVPIQQEEVDFLVTKYTVRDATALSSLGKHCKEISWKVQASHDAAPLDITVRVDKSIMLSPEVNVSCDGKTLFPHDSRCDRAKLLEDFSYQWPFRGSLREGVNEPNRFEVRPHHGRDEWFPATITKQREDGLFEASVKMPDNYGFGGLRDVKYPALNKTHIRDALTKEPLHVTEQVLALEVPQQDPLRAVLKINKHASALQYFGRPTPKSDQGPNQVSLVLSADSHRVVHGRNERITANVGHRVLSHFLSGEPTRVASELQRYCRSWTVQLGPYAEHIIKVERQPWPSTSKIIKLTIDDETLVEASADELGCDNKQWECKFCFSGEKVIDFEVFESNVDGVLLETRGHAITREKYTYNCVVILKDETDLSKALFLIDDNEFQDLHQKATAYEEPNLSLDLQTLKNTYGLDLPQKINWSAPIGVVAGLRALAVEGGAVDNEQATAGFAVVKAAAADAAIAGAVSAANAAANGAAMLSAAISEASPIMARTAEQSGTTLSGWCCSKKPAVANSDSEIEVALVAD